MTSHNKSTFGTKYYSEMSSHRDRGTQEDKYGTTDTQRGEHSNLRSNMLNSNNTHFSYENFHSNGDNFVEMCNELNQESKKENQKALQDYIAQKSNDLTSEFVGQVRNWDQKRLTALEERMNATTESTNRSGDSEIVEETRTLDPLGSQFVKMIKTLHTQCTTYIELIDMSKSLPDEIKIRLKKIYNVMRAEIEIVLKKRQFGVKDNTFFLDFIKGSGSLVGVISRVHELL